MILRACARIDCRHPVPSLFFFAC